MRTKVQLREELDNYKKAIKALRKTNLSQKNKIKAIKEFINIPEQPNIREHKIGNLVDNIEFLEQVFCGGKDNVITISCTGLYKLKSKTLAYDTQGTCLILPCQDMTKLELHKWHNEELEHPVPFVDLFFSINNALNKYIISSQKQVILI